MKDIATLVIIPLIIYNSLFYYSDSSAEESPDNTTIKKMSPQGTVILVIAICLIIALIGYVVV